MTVGTSTDGGDQLRVRVLGPFLVEGHDDRSLGSRKARLLLKVLALGAGAPVGVDRIADALWGDAPPARPADQVSVLVSRLRRVLGAEHLPRTDAGYALAGAWIDLVALRSLVDDATVRLGDGRVGAAAGIASAARRLVRGPLLSEEIDADWVDARRLEAHRLAGRARLVAAEAGLLAGDHEGALASAEEQLDHDPYDETALRFVMRAHAASGRPAAGLGRFASVRDRLLEDLGASPAAETLAVWEELLAASDGRGAASAGPRRARDPLPGRADALAVLDGALPGPGGGRGVVVEVVGESGIGKSTLLDAWVRGLGDDGAGSGSVATVLRGRFEEGAESLVLHAVFDALHARLRTLDEPGRDAVLGPDRERVAPYLGSWLAVAAAPTTGPPSAGAAVGEGDLTLLFDAVVAVLGRLGGVVGSGPVVLVLDDLHLAGAATVQWLGFVRRRAPAGLVVVFACRPEGRPEVDATWTIELGPLDLEATAEVVGAERAAELHTRSGGHPLFLVELAGAGDDAAGSETIRSSVAARHRQMGASGRTIAVAAVLGRDVDLELLAAVVDRPMGDVLDDLEAGVRHRMLDETGDGFTFRHELVRAALIDGISGARRRVIHGAAVPILLARPGTDPLDVAEHAEQAGDRRRAAELLGRAAAEPRRRSDPVEVLALLDRAVLLDPDHVEVRVMRGVALVTLGRYAEAADDAEWAVARGGGSAAFELLGWSHYYRRTFDAARRAADEGVRLATAIGDDHMAASCLVLAGRVRHAVGELVAADERLTEAADRAERAGVAIAPVWLGDLRVHQGRAAEALDAVERSRLLRGEADHPFAMVHGHLARAYALGLLGRAEEALAALDDTDRHIEERSVHQRFVGRTDNWRGWVLRHLGAFAEADDRNVRSEEQARRIDLAEPQAHAVLDRADGCLLLGDLPGAAHLLDTASSFDEGAHVMAWRHALRNRLLRGRLALATGDRDGAEAIAASLVADAARRGAQRYVVLGEALGLRAELHRQDGADHDRAVDSAVRGLHEVAGLEAWWWLAQLADDLGSDRLRALARAEAATLAAHAGAHRPTFERWAAGILDPP